MCEKYRLAAVQILNEILKIAISGWIKDSNKFGQK